MRPLIDRQTANSVTEGLRAVAKGKRQKPVALHDNLVSGIRIELVDYGLVHRRVAGSIYPEFDGEIVRTDIKRVVIDNRDLSVTPVELQRPAMHGDRKFRLRRDINRHDFGLHAVIQSQRCENEQIVEGAIHIRIRGECPLTSYCIDGDTAYCIDGFG